MTKRQPPATEPLLATGEVAALFGVSPQTICRWADTGKFGPGVVIRTPGGTRRFKVGPVLAMRDGKDQR